MPDPQPAATRAGQVYEVFAKFRKEEPLHHIGNVIDAMRSISDGLGL